MTRFQGQNYVCKCKITTQIELPNKLSTLIHDDFQLRSLAGAKTLFKLVTQSVLPNEEERRIFNLLFRNLFTSLQNRRDFFWRSVRRAEASVRRARSVKHAPRSPHACLLSPEKRPKKITPVLRATRLYVIAILPTEKRNGTLVYKQIIYIIIIIIIIMITLLKLLKKAFQFNLQCEISKT